MPVYTRADNLASVGTGFEPQRQHNWALELNLPGDDGDYITLSIASGFLPAGYNDELAIPYGNEVVYVAGKAMWDAGTIVLRDWIDRPTAKILLDWRVQVYNPTTGAIGLASDYKQDASIILFGPNVVDKSEAAVVGERVWTLHGAWPIRVSPAANGLDMSTSGQVMIEMVLRYDKATSNFINYIPVPRISINNAASAI